MEKKVKYGDQNLVIDVAQESNTINLSYLPAMIEKIEKQVKLIDSSQTIALEAIELLLNIVNSYAFWVNGLKQELKKLDSLNKSQAEIIHNRNKIV